MPRLTQPDTVSKEYFSDSDGNRVESPVGAKVTRTDLIVSILHGDDSDAMAKEIGVPKGYKSDAGWLLSKTKWKKAVRLGATFLSDKENQEFANSK